jgi:hypothetical protein
MIEFPINPIEGQTFTSGTKSWKFEGGVWRNIVTSITMDDVFIRGLDSDTNGGIISGVIFTWLGATALSTKSFLDNLTTKLYNLNNTVDNINSSYVTLSTTQTITGTKTFSSIIYSPASVLSANKFLVLDIDNSVKFFESTFLNTIDITDPLNDQILRYNSTTSKWVNIGLDLLTVSGLGGDVQLNNGNGRLTTATIVGDGRYENGVFRFDAVKSEYSDLTFSGSVVWDCSTGLSKRLTATGDFGLTLTNLANGMFGDLSLTITATTTITLPTSKLLGSVTALEPGKYHLCFSYDGVDLDFNIGLYE